MKKIFTALILTAGLTSMASASDWASYRVTITNATSGQVLTPPLLVTHNMHFMLFDIAGVASDGLVTQAETGDPSVILAEVSGADGVYDALTATDGIPFGSSATFDISAPRKAMLSFSSMLATTNDGFAALNSVPLPRRMARYYAYAYDAGSEMNNENCSHIPGPPCSEDSGNARTDTGEGFITIHNGIHGGGDLDPQQLDWRGPVAVITVKRLNN